MQNKGNIVSNQSLEIASYSDDVGALNAYAVTLRPSPSSYIAGMKVVFKAASANTGPATLNVNGLGSIPIVKSATSPLSAGDILNTQIIEVTYDGTNFQLKGNPGAGGQGASGYSGYSGISGFSGYSGSGQSGYSGYSGKSGYSGFSGFSGFSGSSTSGFSGFSGQDGAASASGYSGFSGGSGYSGYSGFSGGVGAAGTSGFSGYSGQDGLASASGYSGFSGKSGYSGQSGYSGYSGGPGVSGFSGFSGAGLSGFSGFSGLNGTAASSGYSGYSGPSGYSGFSGKSGYSGFSGPTGNTGLSGFSGYSGQDGAAASSGYSGFSGFSGRSGYSGYSGAGTSGFSGYSGPTGATGTSGFSGFSGRSGYSGFSGSSGYSGFSGAGFSGYSGYSGQDGLAASSGYSGYSGAAGSGAINYIASDHAYVGITSGPGSNGTDGGASNTFGIFVGDGAGTSSSTGTHNIFIGASAGTLTSTGGFNVAIGNQALGGRAVSSFNEAIGYRAGYDVSGDNNINIGRETNSTGGISNFTGSQNITIGYRSQVATITGSNQLVIGNIIYGTGLDGTTTTVSTGSIGIKTIAPAFDFHVNGRIATESQLVVRELASSTTPPINYGYIFEKTDGKFYGKNSAGIEYDLTASGGGGSLTDGDKGDVIVSGSGTIWLFDYTVSPIWTGMHTFRANSLGTTQTNTKGITLENQTGAALNAQQISPEVRWVGQGFATSPALSQPVEFREYLLPVQGISNPFSQWVLQSSVNGGGFIDQLRIRSDYAVNFGTGAATIDHSIAMHGSVVDGVGSIAFSQNAVVHGLNCFQGAGQNTIIDSGTVGAFSGSTDSHLYTLADYAAIFSDANEAWGESSFTAGFGNDNFNQQGAVFGNDNVLGALSAGAGTGNQYFSGFIAGSRNLSTGSNTLALGKFLQVQGDAAMAIGSGVFSLGNRLVNAEAYSLAVGFNSTVPTFMVHTASGAGTYGQTDVMGTLLIGEQNILVGASATNSDGFPATISVANVITSAASNRHLMIDVNGTGGYVIIGDKALMTTAIGAGAQATIQRNIAIGVACLSTGNFDSVGLGSGVQATNNDTVAIGSYAKCAGNTSSALGAYSEVKSTAPSAVAIGNRSIAWSAEAIAIGYNAQAGIGNNDAGVAIGEFCLTKDLYGIAMGQFSETRAAYSLAFGYTCVADVGHANTIVFGRNATSTASNQIIFGNNNSPYTDMYLGRGVTAASPTAFTIHSSNATGTNINGSDLNIAAGASTGSGNGGAINLKTSTPNVSGTTLNALTTRMTVKTNGVINIAGMLTFTNNAAAITGGLVAGDLYAVTGSDPRQIAIVF